MELYYFLIATIFFITNCHVYVCWMKDRKTRKLMEAYYYEREIVTLLASDKGDYYVGRLLKKLQKVPISG